MLTVVAILLGAALAAAGVVVVTHDAHLASWADRIIFLRDGHMVDHVASDLSDSPLVTPSA